MNELQKQFVNFKGLDCTGLKIALFEYTASSVFYKLDIANPLNVGFKDILDPNEVEDYNHVYKCGSIIRDMCKNATITFLPQNDSGVKYAIKNGYHIASFSGGNFFADNNLEKELAKNCYLICAVGNNASNGSNPVARESWWTSVGAFHLVNGKPELAYYSSYGDGGVKLCSFSDLTWEIGKSTVCGTSFATPFLVGLVAEFYIEFKRRFGFFPQPAEAGQFTRENCKPILNDALKEGRGMLILPNWGNYNFAIAIKVPSDCISITQDFSQQIAKGYNNVYIDGIEKQITNPPILLNSKTTVELTLLRECGASVFWHDKERTAIVRIPK